jgi:hypothetical protein
MKKLYAHCKSYEAFFVADRRTKQAYVFLICEFFQGSLLICRYT